MKERPRAEDLSGSLTAADASDRLQALKKIKNSVIGNKREKSKNLAYLPVILNILATDADASVLVQAAQAVGSFASAPEGAAVVVRQGGVPALLKALESHDQRIVEAAARALKLLYKHSDVSLDEVMHTPGALATLTRLLRCEQPGVGEGAATVLARCCGSAAAQDALVAVGALPALIDLLDNSAQRARQAAALAALTAAVDGNAGAAAAVLARPSVLPRLMDLAKSGVGARTRLAACLCLTHLSPHVPSEAETNSGGGGGSQRQQLLRETVDNATLPVLVRMLDDPDVAREVPGALIRLIRGKPAVQASAADADAIPRLAALLRAEGDSGDCTTRRDALLALGMLTESVEAHRRQLMGCGALPAVASALSDASPAVRAAACTAMRSLSRSTRLLRCSLGSLGDVAAPLMALSRSDDLDVATEAAATLVNLAVEYSAAKEQLLVLQGVTRFAELAGDGRHGLRLYGVWGLSSVAYLAPFDIKAAVMEALPWAAAVALLRDANADVREKTLLLLRNMAHKGPAALPHHHHGSGGGTSRGSSVLHPGGRAGGGRAAAAAAAPLEWSGGQLLGAVLDAAHGAVAGQREGAQHAKHAEHALYTVVNVASGGQGDKEAVMAAGWAPVVAAAMEHPSAAVREAAVWAVINLTWAEDGSGETLERRRQELRRLGVVEALRERAADTSLSVRERAATALEQLTGHRHHGGGGSEGSEGDDDEAMDEGEDDDDPIVSVDVELAW